MIIKYYQLNKISKLFKKDPSYHNYSKLFFKFDNFFLKVFFFSNEILKLKFFRFFFWFTFKQFSIFNVISFIKLLSLLLNYYFLINFLKFKKINYFLYNYTILFNSKQLNNTIYKKFLFFLKKKLHIKLFFFFEKNNCKDQIMLIRNKKKLNFTFKNINPHFIILIFFINFNF